MTRARSTAAERILRRTLALRKGREIARVALAAAGEAVREANDELCAVKVAAAKPLHQNEPAPDLVAQLYREREASETAIRAQCDRADRLERANALLIQEVHALSGRAHRAEAELRLRAATALPRIAHCGTPSARFAVQLPAVRL